MPASTDWLISLTACPDPGLPHWWTVPNVSRIGSTRSMVSASPPAMTARVPAAAPCGPPLTGQSRATMPRSAAASASSIAVAGPIVEASMSTDPVRMTSRSPPDPVHTSRTSSGPGRQVTTTSVAASAAATASGSRPALISSGITWYPAVVRRSAIGRPIAPSPTHPTELVWGATNLSTILDPFDYSTHRCHGRAARLG